MAVLQYERGNKPNNVFVTLTTLPTRLNSKYGDLGMKSCIESLLDQSYINKYQIHINIPTEHKHSGEKYLLPDWLITLRLANQSKIKIFHEGEDIGPATKLVPTVSRLTDPENIIIVVDDDLVYHRDMVAEQVANQKKYENSIVGYDGLRAVEPIFNDTRDYYFTANYATSKVDILQHYKSVSYKRKYFEDDFFDFIEENLTWHDDLLIAAYFAYKKRDRIATYHESDTKFESFEEWQSQGGVQTFPVLRHTHHESDEGCNVYRNEKIEDNSYKLFTKYIDIGYER